MDPLSSLVSIRAFLLSLPSLRQRADTNVRLTFSPFLTLEDSFERCLAAAEENVACADVAWGEGPGDPATLAWIGNA